LVRMSFVWVRTGGDRSLCAIERSLSIESSHFEMVEIDKIVSGKRGWVATGNPTFIIKLN